MLCELTSQVNESGRTEHDLDNFSKFQVIHESQASCRGLATRISEPWTDGRRLGNGREARSDAHRFRNPKGAKRLFDPVTKVSSVIVTTLATRFQTRTLKFDLSWVVPAPATGFIVTASESSPALDSSNRSRPPSCSQPLQRNSRFDQL